jgi:hypothetical protein
MKIFFYIISLLLAICSLRPNILIAQNNLSGSLNCDSKISFIQSEKILDVKTITDREQKKSVLLAAGLSAVLPGAGEFYLESYIKSALFLAIEAASITVGLIYNNKGDEQTNFFQSYAHQHWSVERYAKWTVKNASSINDEVKDVTQYKVFNSNGTVNWSELNRLESAIGKYYSHRLPYFGEQQYYELIGKYPQFNVGWDDFGNENTPFVYGDPLTSNFLYYSSERGKANDYYNVAAKAVLIVIVNHILSAVDAALSATSFNKEIEAHASLEKTNIGFYNVYYPQINFKFSF